MLRPYKSSSSMVDFGMRRRVATALGIYRDLLLTSQALYKVYVAVCQPPEMPSYKPTAAMPALGEDLSASLRRPIQTARSLQISFPPLYRTTESTQTMLPFILFTYSVVVLLLGLGLPGITDWHSSLAGLLTGPPALTLKAALASLPVNEGVRGAGLGLQWVSRWIASIADHIVDDRLIDNGSPANFAAQRQPPRTVSPPRQRSNSIFISEGFEFGYYNLDAWGRPVTSRSWWTTFGMVVAMMVVFYTGMVFERYLRKQEQELFQAVYKFVLSLCHRHAKVTVCLTNRHAEKVEQTSSEQLLDSLVPGLPVANVVNGLNLTGTEYDVPTLDASQSFVTAPTSVFELTAAAEEDVKSKQSAHSSTAGVSGTAPSTLVHSGTGNDPSSGVTLAPDNLVGCDLRLKRGTSDPQLSAPAGKGARSEKILDGLESGIFSDASDAVLASTPARGRATQRITAPLRSRVRAQSTAGPDAKIETRQGQKRGRSSSPAFDCEKVTGADAVHYRFLMRMTAVEKDRDDNEKWWLKMPRVADAFAVDNDTVSEDIAEEAPGPPSTHSKDDLAIDASSVIEESTMGRTNMDANKTEERSAVVAGGEGAANAVRDDELELGSSEEVLRVQDVQEDESNVRRTLPVSNQTPVAQQVPDVQRANDKIGGLLPRSRPRRQLRVRPRLDSPSPSVNQGSFPESLSSSPRGALRLKTPGSKRGKLVPRTKIASPSPKHAIVGSGDLAIATKAFLPLPSSDAKADTFTPPAEIISSSLSSEDLRNSVNRSPARITLTMRTGSGSNCRFDLGACIGRGQFGSVYCALDLSTGSKVAVKRVRLDGELEVSEAMGEVDILKRLSHPNIVRYEGMWRDWDFLDIFLEYAEKGSLLQVLKECGPLKEPVAADYTRQILEGLAYLHRNDVVHCDIKAANILLTKDGVVKLSDFGVSVDLVMARRVQIDKDTEIKGSPYWMAPEIIEMSGPRRESDIWSLGCTVIELLTGRPPYADIPNAMTVMFKIVEDGMQPIPAEWCSSLKDFLGQCFGRDPADRPSAEDLCGHDWLKEDRNTDKERQGEACSATPFEDTGTRKITGTEVAFTQDCSSGMATLVKREHSGLQELTPTKHDMCSNATVLDSDSLALVAPEEPSPSLDDKPAPVPLASSSSSSDTPVATSAPLALAASTATVRKLAIAESDPPTVEDPVESLLIEAEIAEETPAHTQAELDLAGVMHGHQVGRDRKYGLLWLRQQQKWGRYKLGEEPVPEQVSEKPAIPKRGEGRVKAMAARFNGGAK